jgi:cell division septation protein DedD
MDFRDRNRTVIDTPFTFPRAVLVSVGLGLAFGGGLIAGGVGDTRVPPPEREPVNALARAEARTRAYEALVKGQPLTWHQELLQPEPATPPPPSLARVKATGTAAVAAHDAASKAPSAAATAATEPTTAPLVVDKAMKAPEPEPEAVPSRAPVVDEAREANVDRDDEAGGEVAKPGDPRRLDAAFARVMGKATPSKTKYAVQLASVPQPEKAKEIAEAWRKKGAKADVVTAEVAGKGTVYRVRVTGFASRDEAVKAKGELNEGIIVAE